MKHNFLSIFWITLMPLIFRSFAQPCDPAPQFRGVASSEDVRLSTGFIHQSEVSIAIDPTNPNRLLVGVNSGPFPSVPVFRQGYYYSTDGGQNWSGSSTLPGITANAGDPAVAFDADGIAFFNYLEPPDLMIQKSTDGGITWGTDIKTIPIFVGADKNHLAIDITNSNYQNNIYVAYSEAFNKIYFSRSIDRGVNYSEAENIDGSFSGTSRGVNLVVGSNGEVYGVWAVGPGVEESHGGLLSPFNDWTEVGAETNLIFNRSTDGGSSGSWNGAVDIFNIQGIKGLWDLKNLENEPIRVNSFPSMAVDHSGGVWDGTLYLVWSEKGSGNDRADIRFSKSTDGGLNWIPSRRVNDDATSNDQWFPWISVNPYGVINIVFYDSRNDANNRYTEVWVAQSADGGESFTNFRVSDYAFMPCPIEGAGTGYMGDYIGIASTAGAAYASWMDPRLSFEEADVNYQVFVDRVDTYQADLLALAHSNRSLDNTATYSNSARHLVKGVGYLHEIFASGGEIFYRRSADNGQNWNSPVKVTTSSQEGGNRAPCITFYSYIPSEGPGTNNLSLVWERDIGNSQYEVWYSKSDAQTINWTAPLQLATVTMGSWQAGALPVISHMNYFNDELLVVVYCSSQGLYYRTSTNFGGSWSSAAQIFSSDRVRYPSLSIGGNFICLLYDLRPNANGVYSRRFDGSAWTSAATVAGPGITGTNYNRRPSINVDPDGDLLAAWMGQIYEGEGIDPYYSIGFRHGSSNNTWDQWFVIFEHEPNVTSSEPSITYYNKGGVNNYGIDIVHSTYSNKIKELTYDVEMGWNEITVTNSGNW